MPVQPAQPYGLLNINKPPGLTSHGVVVRVRKLTGQRKVGHAGTLDPAATGVLLLGLGQATRLLEFLTSSRKQYRAVVCFGVTTDTLDADGQITATNNPAALTEAGLRQLLPQFLGDIQQIPPLYSALKKEGRPLYQWARAKQNVELAPRRVTIYALNWVSWQPPYLTLDVVCSSGTYIRSLARDLGQAAGPGAHLAQLTRTASGHWSLAGAVPLAQLEQETQTDPTTWQKYLYPLDQAITHLPRVTLTPEAVLHVQHGRPIKLETELETAGERQTDLLRAYTPEGDFLAILTPGKSDDTLWQPKKVFHL
ncbi:MAG: tRNA pseudouridine(55) synthase TruB [Anaerolineae bacterium]|nr:tRNA pseudouridine(55) synthase TruB [Anaerolineae bacterium]